MPSDLDIDAPSKVLPFYIVIDESASMAGPSIDAVNRALPDLHSAIASDPVVSDKAMVGVIGFASDARVLVELSRMDDLENLPGAVARDSTSFAAAFRKVREVIARDVDALKQKHPGRGYVLRPTCFFITDGVPTDDENVWRAAHAELTSETFPYRPNIIAFGVAEAPRDVIASIATNRGGQRFAYLAKEGTDPAATLREIIGSLTHSIVSSVQQVGGGTEVTPQLVPPTNIPGVIHLDTL